MKLGYVLLDGCADRPDPRLNFCTPLEAAFTPALDSLASKGQLGRVTTVGRRIPPESDIAVFNMLGYSFEAGYPGRGVIEAVGAGVPFKDGDLALRANFASLKGRVIVDRRAGRDLTKPEVEALEDEVAKVRLTGADFKFRGTISHRGVLVIRADGPLSAEISNTDPAYLRVRGFGAARKTHGGETIQECLPQAKSEAARNAAALVNEFTREALRVLEKSEVNRKRVREGRLPANAILLRDAGDHLPVVPSFREKHGVPGVALVEMPAEVGIAKILRMKITRLGPSNDLAPIAETFLKELGKEAVVYLHIKGPDEFGHDGDAIGKKKEIERIDREFFAAVNASLGRTRLAVSCDHATPCAAKMHSADPVPLLITRTGKKDLSRFTEKGARDGSLGSLLGRDVLRRALSM
jgi:2,3-bisphosphoglycerate-independent phosphoglycerate mutase